MPPADDGGAGEFAAASVAGTGAADALDLLLVLRDLAVDGDCDGATGGGDCGGETFLLDWCLLSLIS